MLLHCLQADHRRCSDSSLDVAAAQQDNTMCAETGISCRHTRRKYESLLLGPRGDKNVNAQNVFTVSRQAPSRPGLMRVGEAGNDRPTEQIHDLLTA